MAATVLLTGAGGASLPLLIRHLRKQGYRVLAADMDRFAVGLYLADRGFVIPGGASAEFLPAIRRIVAREGVDAFVPLVDEELVAAFELEDQGVPVITPRREFIETCLDKHRLAKALEKAGVPTPETRLASEGSAGLAFPLILKPRTGRGSRGVAVVRSEDELARALDSSAYARQDLLLQRYVEGLEFTVSAVVWRDGEVQAVVPKEIISKRGITRLAVTRRNARIDEACRKIQDKLRADGPFNVQLTVDAATGQPMVFEINPRYSTSVSLTMAAGIDEVCGLLAQALGGREAYRFGPWREGVVLLRQTLDEFVDEASYAACTLVDEAGGP